MGDTLWDIFERDDRVHACGGVHCQVCGLESKAPSARALARRGDPATSKEAAASLHREGHLRALLEAYRGAELTSEEAASIAGIDAWQASKRTSDLLSAGLIVEVMRENKPVKRRGRSGRWQRVLTAREEA